MVLPKPLDPLENAGAIRVRFKASNPAIRHAVATMRTKWQEFGHTRDLCDTAETVLVEALNNVVEHAHAGKDDGQVVLETNLQGSEISCQVWDDGVEMPNGTLPAGVLPDVDTELDDLPEGGFGWYLIRTLTESLTYERKPGWNQLCFVVKADG